MSSFVSSLIKRHTRMVNLIRPRHRSMFEPERLDDHIPRGFGINTPDVLGNIPLPVQNKRAKNSPSGRLNNNYSPAADKTISLGLDTRKYDETAHENGTISTASAAQIAKPSQILNKTRSNKEQISGNVEINRDDFSTVDGNNENSLPLRTSIDIIESDSGTQPERAKKNDHFDGNLEALSANSNYTTFDGINNGYLNEPPKAVDYTGITFFERSVPFKNELQATAKQPAIKVTIGQIDVTAITEQPPVTKQSRNTAVPRMSLDDYLKLRNSTNK